MRIGGTIRISVLDAGRTLLQHRAEFPQVSPIDAARQLAMGPCYLANYDFQTALSFLSDTDTQVFRLTGDRVTELRHAIFEIARSERPFWVRMAMYGRRKAAQFLNNDELQCLREAELVETPLDGESRSWWERLAMESRFFQQVELVRIGSEAEQLTLSYEQIRLEVSEIRERPSLVSIEDETAGYDVLSYRKENGLVVPYYIEVKGTTASEPRFFLSRNEWNACVRLYPRYSVYVWDLNTKRLNIFTKNDLEPNVAQDRGVGNWVNLRLPMDLTITDFRPDNF